MAVIGLVSREGEGEQDSTVALSAVYTYVQCGRDLSRTRRKYLGIDVWETSILHIWCYFCLFVLLVEISKLKNVGLR